jgi:hypothetical protein
MTTIPAYLKMMFTDDRWRRIRERIYYGEIDGKKIGVAVATQSPNRDNYALNRAEHERVLNGKLTGKVDLAFVVAAKLNGFGNPPEFRCGNFIEAVSLTGYRPIAGRYGEFWALQLEAIDPDAPL